MVFTTLVQHSISLCTLATVLLLKHAKSTVKHCTAVTGPWTGPWTGLVTTISCA